MADRRERQKISQCQTDRSKTIDGKLQEFVLVQGASYAILFLWTGQIGVDLAFVHCYGQVFEKHWPASLIGKLKRFLRSLMRYFHPSWSNQTGDEEAVKLLENGPGPDVQLSDGNAAAFIDFIQERQIFGRQQVAPLLKDAWEEFKQEQPQRPRSMQQQVTTSAKTPMQHEVTATTSHATHVQQAAPSLDEVLDGLEGAPEEDWAALDAMSHLLPNANPHTNQAEHMTQNQGNPQPEQVGRKRRSHTSGPRFSCDHLA